ncbi:MAG: hypothetical protein UY70_C0030G0010 [Candidatus Kaiserbacteria bacterium GW2011_GWB1_52_6]|uniref:Prepilin-type N-terminal cleavage/methylation domain-containing protein n=3 Tax=Candidatus Kaiseribacteriota TaxID=1752734 RepID=A0A0G1ZMV4_9BACT|nr:MAG: hypothetical protein UY67_C0025G0010 [Candidatus Kaiserbacteria bacterium GW2011_GWA2_52_12]KKW26286.1 MAG: hypothetical protein UY70_C0030G0010 [Candidatus Kaiserbacteria bacterium GW2011_GWB1_52_6]KKW29442.1 MAG: hypothetical protein UY74_C0075G0011 [Candidatus Kaiserbacteria bacterium GW2011_GWC2_52_8b]
MSMNIKKQRTKNIHEGFIPYHFLHKSGKGFTLVETLVAISLLTIAIVAPMSLTMLALSSAIYARDQITAYYLAQEGIEAVRSVRDGNILASALGTPTPIMQGIPNTTGAPFRVDTHTVPATLTDCASDPGGECKVLQTSCDAQGNCDLYGYASGWTNTSFTRSVSAVFLNPDEVRVSVTVSWDTSPFNTRSFTISDNLYNWPYPQE